MINDITVGLSTQSARLIVLCTSCDLGEAIFVI